MKKISIKIIYMFLAVMSLMACHGDEVIETIIQPDMTPLGHVVAEADVFKMSNTDKPVVIDGVGDTVVVINSEEAVSLKAGNYRIVTVIPSDGLQVEGTFLMLPTQEAGEVLPAPHFKAGVSDLRISKNETTFIFVRLEEMSRELHLKPIFPNDIRGEIKSVTATLYGVLNEIDLAQGFGKIADRRIHSNTNVFHTKVTDDGYSPGNILRMRLLGMDERVTPYLEFTVVTNSGKRYKATGDITTILKTFNTGSAEKELEIEVPVVMEQPRSI